MKLQYIRNALLVIAVILLGAVARAGDVATITLIEGSGAQMQPPGGKWAAAEEDMAVASGAVLKTDGKSRIELQFKDNSILRMNTLTQIKVTSSTTGSKTVEAEKGQTWAHLKKLDKGESFEVTTPTVTCGVRGTTFWVNVEEGEESVQVEDGEIEVTRRGGRKVRLKKRMMARIRAGKIQDPSDFDPEKIERWEKWTEKIVRERLQKLRGELKQFHSETRDMADRGTDMLKKARGIVADMRAASKGIHESIIRVNKLEKETESIKESLAEFKNLKPKQRKNRAQKLRKRVAALLEEADAVAAEFASAREKLLSSQASTQELIPMAISLKKDYAKITKRLETFRNRIQRQQQQREFDPQWPQLKELFDEMAQHENHIIEGSGKIQEAVEAKSVETEEKAQDIQEKMERISDRLKAHQDDILERVKTLITTRKELELILEKIDEFLEK